MSSQMSHRAPPRDRVTEPLVREAALTLFRQGSQVLSELIREPSLLIDGQWVTR